MTAYINGSLGVSTSSRCNTHTLEQHEVYAHKCLFNIFWIVFKGADCDSYIETMSLIIFSTSPTSVTGGNKTRQ